RPPSTDARGQRGARRTRPARPLEQAPKKKSRRGSPCGLRALRRLRRSQAEDEVDRGRGAPHRVRGGELLEGRAADRLPRVRGRGERDAEAPLRADAEGTGEL